MGAAAECAAGLRQVFEQDARLQLGPALLGDPGEFEFLVALGHDTSMPNDNFG